MNTPPDNAVAGQPAQQLPERSEKPELSCTFSANAEDNTSIERALTSPQWLQVFADRRCKMRRALHKGTTWVPWAITVSWTSPGGGASALHHALNLQKIDMKQPLLRLAPSQGSHTEVMEYFLMEKEKCAEHMFMKPLLRIEAAHLHHCSLQF